MMKSLKLFLVAMAIFATGMLMSNTSYSQTSLQMTGSFPQMDGGFEGQNAGALASFSGSGTQRTDWTVNYTTNGTLYATNGRSGPKYFTFNAATGGTAHTLQTPTAANAAIVSATPYTIQYYYRTSGATGTGASMQLIISANGTTGGYVISPSSAPYVLLAGTSTVWTKYSNQITVGSSVSNPRYGLAGIRSAATMGGVSIDVDDFVMYAGALDETPPDPPGTANLPVVNGLQVQLSWAAPTVGAGNGVDGGGYMVVRGTSDPTTLPNPNGIYAVGNTIGSGQVVYVGTNTSCTDAGLASTTSYSYRIYSVDKAFNYSTSYSSTSAITGSPASEPIGQASSVIFSSVQSTQFAVSWSAGGGSNHLVVVRAGSDVTADPVDGTTYTPNTVYGTAAAQLGTGNYIVYNGASTSLTVTGLTKATKYYVRVYEFNGINGTENYLTTGPASANQIASPGEITSNGSAGAGVAWSATTCWTGGVVPGAGDNVTINSPDVILLSASQSCYNLTIASGARLITDLALPHSVDNYLTVYGTSIAVAGTLGGPTIVTPAADGALGLEFVGNVTLTGLGTIRPARLHPKAGAINASFTFAADATMAYYGGTGTGGAGIYTDQSGNDNITITVNAGKTLAFAIGAGLGGGNFTLNQTPTSNGQASTILNINGTVDLSGANSILAIPIASGKTCALNIGPSGSITVGNNFYATGAATPTISVTGPSGSLVVNGYADFSSSTLSPAVTGGGTFTLSSGASISIGAASGLEPVAGPIRTTTRTFSTGANYSFVGTSAQVTGTDMPATVGGLTLAGTAGTTVSQATTVNGTLTLGGNNSYTNLASVIGYTGLTYAATVAQVTGAEFGASITNLTTNNTSGVTLGGSKNVIGTLTMTAGNIALGGNTLTLGTSIGSPGTLTYTAGYLTGAGTFTRWFGTSAVALPSAAGQFPMGVGSNNRGLWIGGTPSVGGTVSVQYNDASTVSTVSISDNAATYVNQYAANWVVATGNSFAGTTLGLQIQGSGIPGITVTTDLNITGASSAAAGTFVTPGGTPSAPVLQRSAIADQTALASTYYISSLGGSALPVEMTSFVASMQSANCAMLKWSTATEVNNSGFEIQRRAEGTSAWAKVAFVASAGTSNSPKDYTYQDAKLAPGVYVYRIKQIDNNGAFKYSASTQVDAGVAKGFELLSNYPNPFNPTTNMQFSVPQDGYASLKVYNMLGQMVATLFEGMAKSGHYVSVTFNASEMASGVYFSRLEYNGRSIVQRMLLAK